MADLPAGAALDRVIAERVMGLQPCDAWESVNFGSAGGPALAKGCEHEHCYSTRTVASMFGYAGGPPSYSTSCDAMGTLVAHLKTQGWRLKLWDDETLDQWACRFYQRTTEAHRWSVERHADTPCHAVALAALETVSHEQS